MSAANGERRATLQRLQRYYHQKGEQCAHIPIFLALGIKALLNPICGPFIDIRNSVSTTPRRLATDAPTVVPGEAPQWGPQNRYISSPSEKNSSSSSSVEPRLVKSILYLSRPPIPPNPLTN